MGNQCLLLIYNVRAISPSAQYDAMLRAFKLD